jgi:hypothetical protein
MPPMSKKPIVLKNDSIGEVLLYKTPNSEVKVEVYLINEMLWLTQKAMANLFDCSVDNISLHLKNLFSSGELRADSVTEDFSTTAADGKKYKTKHYNLDAVIAIGYRVNSHRATMFRIWATSVLKEYIIKGFAMDDERLKNPQYIFGKDYFEEQLERIRDIRSSERRFYQKITDIYAQCSSDYDRNSEITTHFFATVQNKLHWAISRQTAAEIIYDRANHEKTNMGLTNWKNAPLGRIRKSDVSIAKNYLFEEELENLNRIVAMYLDYAENQAKKQIPMTMKDWESRLDAFLRFNEEEILNHSGKVSAEIAKAFVENEFEQYRVLQDKSYKSDFDKFVESVSAIEQETKE